MPLAANEQVVEFPVPDVSPIFIVPSGGLLFPVAVSVTLTEHIVDSPTVMEVGVQLIEVSVVLRSTLKENVSSVKFVHLFVSLDEKSIKMVRLPPPYVEGVNSNVQVFSLPLREQLGELVKDPPLMLPVFVPDGAPLSSASSSVTTILHVVGLSTKTGSGEQLLAPLRYVLSCPYADDPAARTAIRQIIRT